MNPLISTIISTVVGIFVSVLTGFISYRLKKFDEDNLKYRKEREEKEKAEAERQRLRDEANDQLTLGMARTMLLSNYEKCITKGYYSVA